MKNINQYIIKLSNKKCTKYFRNKDDYIRLSKCNQFTKTK